MSEVVETLINTPTAISQMAQFASSILLVAALPLTHSPTALMIMCNVSHPLPPHAHPALTIQPNVDTL